MPIVIRCSYHSAPVSFGGGGQDPLLAERSGVFPYKDCPNPERVTAFIGSQEWKREPELGVYDIDTSACYCNYWTDEAVRARGEDPNTIDYDCHCGSPAIEHSCSEHWVVTWLESNEAYEAYKADAEKGNDDRR